MRGSWAASLVILILVPTVASAQAINGSADWGYGRSTSRTDDQVTENGSFTQAYTVGYQSVLWDPRFFTYSGELSFHKNALSFDQQDGASRQTGYKASATLFPARHFPLSVNASRTMGNETANYPSSSPIRGGLELPTGDIAPLKTGQSALSVSWQFNDGRLPRAELSYQKGASDIAVGPLNASQQQRTLHALVARDGPRVRSSLRYDRNGFENALSQAFTQRYTELSYDFAAAVSPRTSATVRAGRRSTFSLFDVPRQFSGVHDVAYRPPSTGEVRLYYGVATVSHARSRLAADLTTSYDREKSDGGSADALLGAATTRYTVFPGLTLTGNATYGRRHQLAHADLIRVTTRSAAAGAEYVFASRFLQANAGYDEGHGRSTGELGAGRTRTARSRAYASTGLLPFVDLSVGYDRSLSRDDLLEFGNQWQERTRATARSRAAGPLLLEASWEQANVERGWGATTSQSRYVQSSGTAAFNLWRDQRVSASVGRFRNRSLYGEDSTKYVGVTLDGSLVGALRLTITARREHTFSDISRLDQAGYYTTGAFEYRLRLFTFALEHRYTDLTLSTAAQLDPVAFTGNQILFRVGRRFGFAP